MDKFHIINRGDLPYFQDWIRKVSGRQVWIHTVDEKWAIKEAGGGDVPEWFQWGDAWAGSRIIYVDFFKFEFVPTTARYFKAVLLHEMGHLIHRRKNHGNAGKEYLAQMYGLRKASKLGLEAERMVLSRFSRAMQNNRLDGNNYSIAYRMLRNVGAV